MLIVLMGVCGTGKTTAGTALAQRLGCRFLEGDRFHPRENVERMRAGIPLADADRAGWIDAIVDGLAGTQPAPAIVLACSALTPFVRDRLSAGAAMPIRWVLLEAPPDVLEQRMRSRDHFMPPELLASQLATLDVPADALRVDATQPVDRLVDDICERLR